MLDIFMKQGEIIKTKIKNVRFHKEERKASGELYGNYSGEYTAVLDESPEGIACVDSIAQQLHPDWVRKTEKRAQILSSELYDRSVEVRVKEVFSQGEFEADII